MKEELRKRIQKTQEEARARLAKRGVMRFRCSESDILRLNEYAYQNGFPIGTLIRKWVLERLDQEMNLESSSVTGLNLSQELKKFDKRLRLVEKLVQQKRRSSR